MTEIRTPVLTSERGGDRVWAAAPAEMGPPWPAPQQQGSDGGQEDPLPQQLMCSSPEPHQALGRANPSGSQHFGQQANIKRSQ